MSERTSFVNDDFDDLASSEGSKENIHPVKAEMSSVQQEVNTDQEEVKLDEQEPQYDELIFATTTGPSLLFPTTPIDNVPTLEVEHEDSDNDSEENDGSNPFLSANISPTKLSGVTTVGTSLIEASGNLDNGGTHRPLPDNSEVHYDSILNDNLLRSDTASYDLQVNITARERHDISKTDSYVTYKIETCSLRPRHLYEESEYVVWRRYRDFEWLHDQLEKSYPTLIIPPLPGKQITRYFDHMSETFLEERQRCLDQFLWRLVVHPFYSYDNSLKMFLTADNEAFATHITDTTSSNKLFDIMSSTVKQATTAMRLKNPDTGFNDNSKYFASLNEKIGVLERIETRLHGDRKELATICSDFSAVFDSWANSESIDLSSNISQLSGTVQANASSLNTLNESNSYSFQLALRMYQLYTSNAVQAIKRRDALQLEYELATDERDRKKKMHEAAVEAGREDKVTKIAADLEKVGVAAEQAQDKLAHSNEQLRVDIEKWKEAKDVELKSIFVNWADNQIQYHERMFHEWEELLLSLRKQDTTQSEVVQNDY